MASTVTIDDNGLVITTEFNKDPMASDDEKAIVGALSIILGDDRGFDGLAQLAQYFWKNPNNKEQVCQKDRNLIH